MKLTIFIFILLICGCTQIREASCDEIAEFYRPDSLNMLVTKPSKSIFKFRLEGIYPKTGRNAIFSETNYTWAQDFNKYIQIGDTVVKRQGELQFAIHKKDTVLVFPFECDGKVFK